MREVPPRAGVKGVGPLPSLATFRRGRRTTRAGGRTGLAGGPRLAVSRSPQWRRRFRPPSRTELNQLLFGFLHLARRLRVAVRLGGLVQIGEGGLGLRPTVPFWVSTKALPLL